MKRIFFLLLLSCISSFLKAQTTEDSVKSVINRMFDAMKNSDAMTMKSSFSDNAVLQTISRDATGKTMVQSEALAEFIDFVSKQVKGAADERIFFDVIKIGGPLAMVWAPYRFYYNGQFSHCGVDMFTLVRINNEWKIQYLIDTRRRTGCD